LSGKDKWVEKVIRWRDFLLHDGYVPINAPSTVDYGIGIVYDVSLNFSWVVEVWSGSEGALWLDTGSSFDGNQLHWMSSAIAKAERARELASLASSRNSEGEKQSALINYLASPEFEEDIDEGILEIHERYGQLMLEMVQNNCPVVSGNLRDSFSLTVSSDGVSIDSFCEYYPYIESLYGMVAAAYGFYEPMIMTEIEALIASKVSIS